MSLVSPKCRDQIVARVLAARQRRAGFLLQMKELQQQGYLAACKVAAVLKREFGAQRVVLFGSMLNHEYMTDHSDIDLAVWGIKTEDYLRAGIAAEQGHHFPIDLIDAELAPSYIRDAINQGIEL